VHAHVIIISAPSQAAARQCQRTCMDPMKSKCMDRETRLKNLSRMTMSMHWKARTLLSQPRVSSRNIRCATVSPI
jgi:hypothetical protein